MKLTRKQEKDIETIKYFFPENKKSKKEKYLLKRITNRDIENFLLLSERGKRKRGRPSYGFQVLKLGKMWRGRHIHEIYEPAILDGMGYASFIDETTPISVVEFLSKEMFKGTNKELIFSYYENICK